MSIKVKFLDEYSLPVRFEKLFGIDGSVHLRPIVKFVDLEN